MASASLPIVGIKQTRHRQQTNNGGNGHDDGPQQLLPPLPQYAGAATTDAEMAAQVAEYLRQLLARPAVTASRPFLGLLNDHDGAGGAESSGLVPVRACVCSFIINRSVAHHHRRTPSDTNRLCPRDHPPTTNRP